MSCTYNNVLNVSISSITVDSLLQRGYKLWSPEENPCLFTRLSPNSGGCMCWYIYNFAGYTLRRKLKNYPFSFDTLLFIILSCPHWNDLFGREKKKGWNEEWLTVVFASYLALLGGRGSKNRATESNERVEANQWILIKRNIRQHRWPQLHCQFYFK